MQDERALLLEFAKWLNGQYNVITVVATADIDAFLFQSHLPGQPGLYVTREGDDHDN